MEGGTDQAPREGDIGQAARSADSRPGSIVAPATRQAGVRWATDRRRPCLRQEGVPMAASPTVRAAAVQAAAVAFDRDETLAKAGRLAADAARRGARLVVFPEAFVPGYPWGEVRTDAERERYWASAVEVPGPSVDA